MNIKEVRQLVKEKDEPGEVIKKIKQKGLDPTLAAKLGGIDGNGKRPAEVDVIEKVVEVGMKARQKSHSINAPELQKRCRVRR
ncbi:MAG: hypothetical protein V5A57_03465 [Candidatus Paceibacterota bacterium]